MADGTTEKTPNYVLDHQHGGAKCGDSKRTYLAGRAPLRHQRSCGETCLPPQQEGQHSMAFVLTPGVRPSPGDGSLRLLWCRNVGNVYQVSADNAPQQERLLGVLVDCDSEDPK